jgi:hypothetical protein
MTVEQLRDAQNAVPPTPPRGSCETLAFVGADVRRVVGSVQKRVPRPNKRNFLGGEGP